MNNVTQGTTMEQAVEQIVSGTKPFKELNLTTTFDFEVAISALRRKADLVKTIVVNTPEKEKLITEWIEDDYKRITYLSESQLTSKIVNAYFKTKIRKTYNGEKENPLGNMCYSAYDKNLILVLTWETTKSELLRYYDKELQVPAELRGRVRIKVKIVDAIQLLKAIDIDLYSVDFQYIAREFRRLIENIYREVLFQVMDEENVGYLTLGKHFTQISKMIEVKLANIAADWGVEIKNAEVKEIEIPSNIMDIVREEYINISKERSRMDFEQTIAENSLKNYEKKAEIHSKYPQFQMTLTEAEKDNALTRYLKREEKFKSTGVNVKDEKLREDDNLKDVNSLEPAPVKPVRPTLPTKSNFLNKFFIALAVCIVIGIGLCFIPGSWYIGLIAIIITAIGFGIFGALNINKIKEAKNYPQALAKYNKDMQKYQADYAEYQRKSGQK